MHFAQQLTFESMRRAKNFSKDHLEVELLSVHFEEDVRAVPGYFIQLPHLKRSIQDFVKEPAAKKFPLLADIIETVCSYTDADYIIYTNTDITIVPHFYEAIGSIIALGHDAISINRRRIHNRFKQLTELPLALAQMGKLHPGYDCFVFHRDIAKKFVFSRICIGTGFTSVAFIHNLIAFAENPFISDRLHLTVHLGLEVMPPLEKSVYRFTKNDYLQNILPKLKPNLHLHKFPYSSLSFPKRLLKWMLNPNFSTEVLLELEGKNMRRKVKALIDELRFELLGKIE
jgi:hypothetical protein